MFYYPSFCIFYLGCKMIDSLIAFSWACHLTFQQPPLLNQQSTYLNHSALGILPSYFMEPIFYSPPSFPPSPSYCLSLASWLVYSNWRQAKTDMGENVMFNIWGLVGITYHIFHCLHLHPNFTLSFLFATNIYTIVAIYYISVTHVSVGG